MTLFEQLQRRGAEWLSDLDAERDRAAAFIARYGGSAELDAYLDAREIERTRHLELLAVLEGERRKNHPFLLLEVRPRMLRAELPPAARRRVGSAS